MDRSNMEIAEQLMKQRYLAAQTLKKSTDMSKSPKRNIPKIQVQYTPPTQDSFRNDPSRYNDIDISALVEDKTIHLQTTPNRNTVSFEPKEFAARSTIDTKKTKYYSAGIEDILASSFVTDINNLGESFRESLTSLPKTADMSKMSSLRDSLTSSTSSAKMPPMAKGDIWNLSKAGFDNDWINEKQKELSIFGDTSFKASENQTSKLFRDELEWEQENAVIPEQNMKNKPYTPPKMPKFKNKFTDHVDFSCFSAYLAQGDYSTSASDTSNVSVGNYFNKMSDDLIGMLPGASPPKRTPVPLVDVSNFDEQLDDNHHEEMQIPRSSRNRISDSKDDKENSSYTMSLSSISKALSSMDPKESPTSVINKMLLSKKSKSCVTNPGVEMGEKIENSMKTMSLGSKSKNTASFINDFEKLRNSTINEENQVNAMSDTASFTESLLASSLFYPQSEYVSSPRPSVQLKFPQLNNAGDTYRVATAKKNPRNKIVINDIPKVSVPPAMVPNSRKRRSSSATRQDVQEKINLDINSKRSRSPSNNQELRAVASTNKYIEYRETPKSSMQFNKRSQAAFSSPEPMQFSGNKSPSLLDRTDSIDRMFLEPPKSPLSSGKLSLPIPSRSNSQCSSGSEFSHRDGAIPLKSTHSELSWGTVKLRKSDRKVCQIKNTSSKKLILKTSISGPGFQMCGPDNLGTMTLQSQECRSISIDFCPTILGPAIGVLMFQSPSENASTRSIMLFGYGGDASVYVEGTQKGPIGVPFLTLGEAQHLSRPLEKSFTLYNKGNLTAFARIGIDKKGIDCEYLATSVYVHPQKVLIPPNSYARINVKFRPKRQEINKMLKKPEEVLSVANLHILCGDEPTRQRIRKKIKIAKQNNLQDKRISKMESLWDAFPNEKELCELEVFSELVFNTIYDLFLSFREHEIVLTVNRSLDETIMDLTMEDDASVMFKTMCSVTSGENASSTREIADDMSPAVHSTTNDNGESWCIRPTYLEFRSSYRHPKQFVIKSNFCRDQIFELNSNYRHLFTFTPEEGRIRPGQEVTVTVDMMLLPKQIQQQIVIIVYIENEKITIPVYVKNDGLTPLFR